VAVSISRFDGTPGRSVVLQGRWELRVHREGREESLGMKAASVVEQVDGPEYDALVAAMQKALVRFGDQMADGIAAASRPATAR
jgi:uncharacterized lipoprotein YmbA